MHAPYIVRYVYYYGEPAIIVLIQLNLDSVRGDRISVRVLIQLNLESVRGDRFSVNNSNNNTFRKTHQLRCTGRSVIDI